MLKKSDVMTLIQQKVDSMRSLEKIAGASGVMELTKYLKFQRIILST